MNVGREPRLGRTGLWLIGARGAIATCVAYGLSGLRQGWLEPVGLATECEPFNRLIRLPFSDLVLGGHDVVRRSLGQSAAELSRARILPEELVALASQDAAELDGRIRPGVLDGPDVGVAELAPESSALGALPPLQQIERLAQDLRAFRSEHGLARLVVVNLASTEAWREFAPEWASLAAWRDALAQDRPQPASLLYAAAAFEADAAFVNFTPNRGSSVPALRELASERKLPHCGNDGKTGETLLKTVLAPMFKARALRVLSWQGYNMLGNRDGEVLSEPGHRAAKLRNKDEALRSILKDERLHSHVGIDYVPSLGDWKTAFDYVHFEGFLGARMSLQFTWQGSDSALAAPLVIDLARFADLALQRGECGEMAHTACYFKSPLAGGTHDFHVQFQALVEYAQGVLRNER